MVISYYYHTLWLLAGGILGIYCFERDHIITCSGVPVYYRFRISCLPRLADLSISQASPFASSGLIDA